MINTTWILESPGKNLANPSGWGSTLRGGDLIGLDGAEASVLSKRSLR